MLEPLDAQDAEPAGGETSPAPSPARLRGIAILGSQPQTRMMTQLPG